MILPEPVAATRGAAEIQSSFFLEFPGTHPRFQRFPPIRTAIHTAIHTAPTANLPSVWTAEEDERDKSKSRKERVRGVDFRKRRLMMEMGRESMGAADDYPRTMSVGSAPPLEAWGNPCLFHAPRTVRGACRPPNDTESAPLAPPASGGYPSFPTPRSEAERSLWRLGCLSCVRVVDAPRGK
jgi:hypothetical protein